MTNNIAQLRFIEHKFIDTQIKIDPAQDVTTDLQVKLESNAMDLPEANRMRLDLTTLVSDVDKIIDIKVTVSAMFEYDNTLSNEAKDTFFKCNAPAIVFPFLRAYINSLTALSGIKPVVLPTFNFSAAR